MRVLSWNLYHGRDFPPDPALFTLRSRLLKRTERNDTHVQVNRPLLDEFARVLAGLEWDVALLQEAPPRWFGELPRRAGAEAVRALTSRNVLPALQGAFADWNPDLIGSWEGGSNQILVRAPGRIADHRTLTLTRKPERRTMHWVRLEPPGGAPLGIANLHATAGRPERASAEVLAAAEAAVDWTGAAPLVLAGDFNLRPAASGASFATLRERYGLGEPTAPDAIDHILARGLAAAAPTRRLPNERRELPGPDGLRLRLSDHRIIAAEFVA
jgi:endonuclease/exonuclease/phosphatase family metal-dependent hydrolase